MKYNSQRWKMSSNAEQYSRRELRPEEDLLLKYLGYLPVAYDSEHTTRIYESWLPLVKGAMTYLAAGKYDQEEFDKSVYKYVQRIRNEDMEYHKCNEREMSEASKEAYAKWIPDQVQTAKERLAKFLGYVPDPAHAYQAEISLRTFASAAPPDLRAPDFRAMTMVKYREVLFSQGREAAEKMPLLKTILGWPLA